MGVLDDDGQGVSVVLVGGMKKWSGMWVKGDVTRLTFVRLPVTLFLDGSGLLGGESLVFDFF